MRIRVGGAIALIVLFFVHASTKSWSQMMWACHIATLAIAFGALLQSRWLLAAGTLFHAGSGIPTYILGVLTTGENSVTSVMIHVLPISLGIHELWRLGTVPRWSAFGAWFLYLAAMFVGYFVTDPKLNINLVHEPWEPLKPVFTQVWMSWVANGIMTLALVLAAERGLRWVFARARRRREPAARELAA